MSTLVIELPVADAATDLRSLAWLMAKVQADQKPDRDRIAVRMHDADSIRISMEHEGGTRKLLAVAASVVQPRAGLVEIAPGLQLQPDPDRLNRFLGEQWRALDHLGINFSHRELDERTWQSCIAELSALVPAYRLSVGSTNDIVFIVMEETGTTNAAVVELVYDRTLDTSSAHFCVRVGADRNAIEREFAAPRGGYKAGDEAFFRSVALPALPRLPVYVDLAFSDAPMAPWPDMVRAIGQRLG